MKPNNRLSASINWRKLSKAFAERGDILARFDSVEKKVWEQYEKGESEQQAVNEVKATEVTRRAFVEGRCN